MEDFLSAVKDFVRTFRSLNPQTIKIISHLDSDGLSSSAILIKAFQREEIPFSLMTVRQLDDLILEETKREHYSVIFFLDLGSGSLSKIEHVFPDREVFILDHHSLEDYRFTHVHLLNPHLYGIDGSKEISGAGITYLFAKALNPHNMSSAFLALIGAIGDMQEYNGFASELNNFILEDAVNSGEIEIKIGLRMFGTHTRPLNKVLEYATDPYIPGVSGNLVGVHQFLDELGIDATIDGKYKKLIQLSQDDLKKLVTGIILRRLGSEERPDDVLGKIYLLREEDDESPTKDAKEFSTLLNACGRMNKPSLGIGCCLNDKKLKKEAIHLLTDYKREIIASLNWFHSNKNTFIEGEGFVLINAGNHIKDTMIGTLASLIVKSNIYAPETIILSFAYTLDGHIKVSVRCRKANEIDLMSIIHKIVEKVGGVAGGHKYAAGALVSQDREKEFITHAQNTLTQLFLEHKKIVS